MPSSFVPTTPSELAVYSIRFCLIAYFLHIAFTFRLHAINEYGRVIHEFDPWFNYRATEYLHSNGLAKFFTWFDYMSWYPLGRPVGTTIYPGLQMTSCFICDVLKYLSKLSPSLSHLEMSLNDVCCFVPAWFGTLASAVTGLFTYEVSGSVDCGIAGVAVMSMIPAHMMRSIGGGYDNESIALFAMMLTFYFWIRSLRCDKSWWIGSLAGLAYVNMVAAWGGYVFVLNMVGIHCAALILLGRFTPKLHKSFTLFYAIGTFGALQIPVVGWVPLKSLEQLGSFAVFGGIQFLAYAEHCIKKKKLTTFKEKWTQRVRVYAFGAGLGLLLILCAPQGYFGPLSSRIRGLFVKHTRTGNPLVDSVAEHQPASASAYYQYLNVMVNVAPIGWAMLFYKVTDAKIFLALYGCVAYFFSAKMVRLVILLGPVASSCAGVVLGFALRWAVEQILGGATDASPTAPAVPDAPAASPGAGESSGKKNKKNKQKKSSGSSGSGGSGGKLLGIPDDVVDDFVKPFKKSYYSEQGQLLRKVVAVAILGFAYLQGNTFKAYCLKMSEALSNPSIMFKAQLRSGETVIIDDYREAYHWLRDNTPEDSRVAAWWDYGYQITGIGNRTTIADGNTWNHEHIALLGKALTGPEKESHRIIRHLADYVLVWAGGGGDDLAKSPHMARIANSVYRDVCPGDPTCRSFGFVDKYGTPSPKMGGSLLYKLHSHNTKQGVQADPNRFKEVFGSRFGKVRIFKVLGVSKESREWVANPENRVCDCDGCWYCSGQYPPALEAVLSKKKDFAQLEDFNAKKDKKDADEYQKAYMENMADPKKAAEKARRAREVAAAKQEEEQWEKELGDEAIESAPEPPERDTVELTPELMEQMRTEIGKTWDDNDYTSRMWEYIKDDATEALMHWLQSEPQAAYVRSKDGRGPMFWAHEYKRENIIEVLTAYGVKDDDKDVNGKVPADM